MEAQAGGLGLSPTEWLYVSWLIAAVQWDFSVLVSREMSILQSVIGYRLPLAFNSCSRCIAKHESSLELGPLLKYSNNEVQLNP